LRNAGVAGVTILKDSTEIADDANRYGPGDLMKLGEEGVGWSVIPLDLTDEQGRKETP